MSEEIPPQGIENFLNFPALLPPTGVTPNFIDPENRSKTIIITSAFLTALAILSFIIRIYTRCCINKKLGWEDLTCALAVPFYLGAYVASILGIFLQTSDEFTKVENLASETNAVGVHQYDLKVKSMIGTNFVLSIYLIIFATSIALLFIKLTFFLLYLRLFRPMRWLRTSAAIGAIVNIIVYLSFIIIYIILLIPRQGETSVTILIQGTAPRTNRTTIFMAAAGFIIDMYILVLPIIGVFHLQLPTRLKIEASVIFMIGSLGCFSSLLCVYYRTRTYQSQDKTWALLGAFITVIAEISVGITCACTPAFFTMIRHHQPFLNAINSKVYSCLKSIRLPATKTGSSEHLQPQLTPNYYRTKANGDELRANGHNSVANNATYIDIPLPVHVQYQI